jgi:hypothetical protein
MAGMLMNSAIIYLLHWYNALLLPHQPGYKLGNGWHVDLARDGSVM